MLAVSTSTGGGTAFHYDQGDAGKPFARLKKIVLTRTGHVYSVILILKTRGALHLPEMGCGPRPKMLS
jgi:hypothetical protein